MRGIGFESVRAIKSHGRRWRRFGESLHRVLCVEYKSVLEYPTRIMFPLRRRFYMLRVKVAILLMQRVGPIMHTTNMYVQLYITCVCMIHSFQIFI